MAESGVAPGKGKADCSLESQSLKVHNFAPRRARTDLTADLESSILCETRRHMFSTAFDQLPYSQLVVTVATAR
jgi:hypothetical protein